MAWLHDISTTLMTVQFILLLVILLRSFGLNGIHSVTKLHYLLWIASLSTSNLYYLTHTLQNKGLYLPFSVMDIVDLGVYALLASVLQQIFSISLRETTAAGTAGALFGAVNVWLWILWSGSWLGNIINAVPFIYLMFVCVRSSEESGAFTKTEGICFMSVLGVIGAAESILYFLKGTAYMVLDIICYIMLFSCTLYLIFKCSDSLRRGTGDRAFALSASAFAMSVVTVYLSYEPIYFVAEVLAITSMVLTYLAISKKDKEETA